MADPVRFLCKASTAASMDALIVEEPAPGCGMRCVAVGAVEEAVEAAFERVVEAECGGGPIVYCRVLIPKTLIGPFMGRKGQNVERIRRDSGARIRVLPLDAFVESPAPSTHEVVQISGDPLAAKKAVMAVSIFLQANPPLKRERIDVGSSFDPDKVSCPNVNHGSHGEETKKNLCEVSYRLLCLNHHVGGVIGRGATIIKALEKETGASIRCGSVVAHSDERAITITGFEAHETGFSPTQHALIRVFNRIIEALMERRVGLETERTTARLLVPAYQIGCLRVEGGAFLSEIRKATGTDISIIAGSQVPKCACESDEVVQVSGRLPNVQDSLFQITRKLREIIFSTNMHRNYASGTQLCRPSSVSFSKELERSAHRFNGPLTSSGGDNPASLAYDFDNLRLHPDGYPSSSHLRGQKRDNSSSMLTSGYAQGPGSSRQFTEPGRVSKAVVMTNTMEIVVPRDCIPLVYGNNGANLSSIRQISGAKVIVTDPQPGASEGIVIISGTPDQTLAAQSILQAYILSGKS